MTVAVAVRVAPKSTDRVLGQLRDMGTVQELTTRTFENDLAQKAANISLPLG